MTELDSISLVGRLVILSSIAYYGLDSPLVTDAQFDEWCQRLHKEWDNLDAGTQWKLGDPHSVHSSGFHIKCTDQDLGGLVVWLRSKNCFRYRLGVSAKSWNTHGRGMGRFRYCNVGDVSWDTRHPIA